MQLLSHFLYAVSLRTFIISGLSIAATATCEYLLIVGDMPMSLIGLAVVFPLVFSINASFQRRDEALNQYGKINANLASLYFAHKGWTNSNQADDNFQEIKKLSLRFLEQLKVDLTNEESPKKLKAEIYEIFGNLSKKNEIFLQKGMPDAHAIVSSWVNEIMQSYEALSNISDYRTPKALRAYSKVFLNLFPLIFSPYFANLNQDITYMGYLVALIYSVVLVMLSNIQDNVENPFDNMGLDDIDLDKENRIKELK